MASRYPPEVGPKSVSGQEVPERSSRGWWKLKTRVSPTCDIPIALMGVTAVGATAMPPSTSLKGKGDRESASPSSPTRRFKRPLTGGSESAEITPLSSPSVTSQLDTTGKNIYDGFNRLSLADPSRSNIPGPDPMRRFKRPAHNQDSCWPYKKDDRGSASPYSPRHDQALSLAPSPPLLPDRIPLMGGSESDERIIRSFLSGPSQLNNTTKDTYDAPHGKDSKLYKALLVPRFRRPPPEKLSHQEIYGRTSVRTQLSLELQGQSHTALADTGSQENVMSAALAKKLHLDVQTDHLTTHSFENAVGKRMKVAGHATVDCRFSDEPHNPINMKFWILEKVVVPLIVGRRFLEETSCLTRFRYRLQRMNVFRNLSPRILHMEVPRLRLQCRVGDQLILANPDTGSDLDLMSASYFQQSNFRLQKLEHPFQSVQFADGSTARLSGFVRVPFAMGSGRQPTDLRDFHVLEGLTTDILLGNGTLEDFDAFNAYKDDFFDLDEFDVRCDLHYIRWVVSRSGSEEFLESPFEDFEFMVTSIDEDEDDSSVPQTRRSWSQILRRKQRKNANGRLTGTETLSKRSCSRADLDPTVSESEARYAQYLRYQDEREARRRWRTDEDIAKRPPSQRQTALGSEQQLRRSYDERRDAFIARYRAAVAAATRRSGP
ncbi:hypothetical protein LTR47_010600 [Exophiala xenobiotica]|nr:hypothetical protein LTR47_010600 [Exophiala xenobiotica]KAK5241974.1 hypothetical protein LTS06_011807 [Exophiala xenobiotica]KAK5348733.1 hypothetical protein LTR61_007760 [Exophiala xenobiotica]KAK5366975.1 hypothetical protein LTR11_008143 [Exophiala xenobiotica]